MPRSKNVNTYPKALWQICERCAVGKEEFAVEVESIQKALSLQGKFYAFRGALRQEYERVAGKKKDPAWEEKLQAYLEFSAQTVCWVDRPGPHDLGRQLVGPAKVRFVHRDNTPSSELFDRILASGRTQGEVADKMDESIQELLGKLHPGALKGS
jgi:hypothetical protein